MTLVLVLAVVVVALVLPLVVVVVVVVLLLLLLLVRAEWRCRAESVAHGCIWQIQGPDSCQAQHLPQS